MAHAREPDSHKALELLEKILVVQLFALGTPQDRIARVVGRQKLWVNGILKEIPKGGSHGEKGNEKRRR